jgi:predicted ester cyclase
MSEDNKAIVRKLLEGADRSDISVVDELVSADYVDHNPPPFQGSGTGADGARDAFTTAMKIFSDWTHEVPQQFTDGDFVISRIVGRGRHTGDFLGIPASNKDVTMEGIAIHRVVDGKVVEHWSQVDGLGLLSQIGAIPPMG